MEFIKMLGRGIIVGSSIALSCCVGLVLWFIALQAGITHNFDLNPYLFFIPPFTLIVPLFSLAMAKDQLPTEKKMLGFFISSVIISLVGIVYIGIYFGQSFDAASYQSPVPSFPLNIPIMLAFGVIFGVIHWAWFTPRSITKLGWIAGPVVCWLIPAIPFLSK